jgi:hypothetical protein
MKVVLPVVIVLVLGGAAFVAYKNAGSIRQFITKLMPGKTQSGEQPPDTGTQPTPAGQVTDSQTTSPDKTAAITDTPPAPPATQPPAAPPPQTAATDVQGGVTPPAGSIPPPVSTPRTRPPAQVTPQLPTTPPAPPGGADIGAPPRVDKTVPAANPPVQVAPTDPVKQPPPVVAADPVISPPPTRTEPVSPPPAAKNPAVPAQVPPRGTLTWSGDAAKDQTLTIESGMASFGTLTGNLPRVPCTVTVQPSDVSIAEAPGPSNGFDRIVLRFRKKGRFNVTVSWETLR